MTNDQKQIIKLLQNQGQSYMQIASTLGISINTLKSYCRRNKIDTVNSTRHQEAKEVLTACKHCDKQLTHGIKGHQKKFCSDECRRAWWKANDNQIIKKAFYILTCAGCGNEFESYGNQNRKFCDHSCYIKSRFFKAGDYHDE